METRGGDKADHGCVWSVGRRSVCGRMLSLRAIGCTSAVCDGQRRCSCGIQLVGLCKCYMRLPVPTSSFDSLKANTEQVQVP